MFGEDYFTPRDDPQRMNCTPVKRREARRGEAVAVPTDVSTVPNHPRDHHHNKNTTAMDLTFALSAIVFTLLALVVATSLLNGSSPAADFMNARGYFGVGSERTAVTQNGHGPDAKKKKKKADDWCEMSCSSHDHWDVVKNVQSEEAQPHPNLEEAKPPAAASSSSSSSSFSSSSCTSSLSVPGTDSRHMSVDVPWPSEAASARGRRSYIGLSDTELLKCAFSGPQTEGAAESPGANADNLESNNPLKYVPGKARSHHMEMMMSKDELEEEQRVQREQLAAIFQLLKDNTETFGEVSEGDLEEQMRLYSI